MNSPLQKYNEKKQYTTVSMRVPKPVYTALKKLSRSHKMSLGKTVLAITQNFLEKKK